ncbi:hypothetical protein [Streptomyces litchfieldiae]|uniref:Uncharacterized protein n=1 Tax=Streptomyces litchfieldiae TaxID=3075543 RepID=A0ABU2MM24_9ACTN|nr:hypothetical protein [Streptomyces sp. DSM 44938]MDT0342418.1 hypothetical protein [Streptomyces sp. DSM 44938]
MCSGDQTDLFTVLAPPPAVCQLRNETRPARDHVAFDYTFLEQVMRDELGDQGW